MLETIELIDWLLEGDPSIRWQALKDLKCDDVEIIEKERNKVATEGWGAELLSLQDKEGTWGGGLYGPKWISTTYTMLLLRRMGLPTDNKQALKACEILLDKGFYKDNGINYGKSIKHSETCITGLVLSILSYFKFDDDRVYKIVEHLLDQQMNDNGWNCRSYDGDTHSSFHTTINVLEGLREYEKSFKKFRNDVIESQKKAREFLLEHKLYQSHRTGETVDKRMTMFSFPPRWYYDIMRILDYFRDVQADHDERMKPAIDIFLKKRNNDGFWKLQNNHPGKTFFEMEKSGQPSRWNTLRGLRILDWIIN